MKVIAVMMAALMAIAVHALMPSDVPVEAFDSFLVTLVGFPVVAVFYFLLLFTHCTLVTQAFGRHSSMSPLAKGLRFGLAFALLYFFGMQEVVVEASPFTEWGLPYVWFQVLMGLGDAIPTVLLCLVVVYCTPHTARKEEPGMPALKGPSKFKAISLIAVSFVLIRTLGYETGILVSNVDTYPVPSYIWTGVFGVVLGCSYVLLYPFFAVESNKLMVTLRLVGLSIGLNWMIYNSFIGMIFSGTMAQMLLRSGLDVFALGIASIVINRKAHRDFLKSRPGLAGGA